MSDEFIPNEPVTPEQPDSQPRQDYSAPEPDATL